MWSQCSGDCEKTVKSHRARTCISTTNENHVDVTNCKHLGNEKESKLCPKCTDQGQSTCSGQEWSQWTDWEDSACSAGDACDNLPGRSIKRQRHCCPKQICSGCCASEDHQDKTNTTQNELKPCPMPQKCPGVYICWFVSCRLSRKYKNPKQGTKCSASEHSY